MIETIKDIQRLVRTGNDIDWRQYGAVYTKEKDGLILFNYSPEAQYKGEWNFFERVSRGLILDSKTGEVVARPFYKFFNWGEGERFSDSDILTVTEKLDGSLGIMYRAGNDVRIATRGSFDSEQAQWATDYIQRNYAGIAWPYYLTLLFEIIYPENRVVVDYGGRERLVLLAARNRESGYYEPFSQLQYLAKRYALELPTVHQFDTPAHIVEAGQQLAADSEGWVVEFADGQRFKFKGVEYLRLHKLISGLSFKRALEAVEAGTVDQYRQLIPDEFAGEFDGWIDEIETVVENINFDVRQWYIEAPKTNRKDFALWVKANCPHVASYMFARLDGRPLEPLIYKLAFRDRSEAAE